MATVRTATDTPEVAPRKTRAHTDRVANDHYIPRFLTAPWEFGERKLRFFDFCTHAFEDVSSKRLFAKESVNSPDVEAWLNKTIETPAAEYANGLRNGGPLAGPTDWRTQRALTLLFFLNSQRIEEALWEKPEKYRLDDFANTSGLDDRVAHLFLSSYKLAVAPIPPNRQLFFTEAGLFGYPMPSRPVLCLPLGLNHALLAYDGPLSVDQLSANIVRRNLSLFSLGVGQNVHRVILPPVWREASDDDEQDVRERLFDLRKGAREMFNLIGKASEKIGLAGREAN